MLIRPWPILILALCYCIAPLGNAVLSALVMNTSLGHYFHLLFQKKGAAELTLIFSIYPICAYAIYSMKKWSYPVFTAVMLFSLARNFQAWLDHPQVFTLPWLIALYALNLAVVSYFLLPAVRAPYFNPNLRWWEAKPRYLVELTAKISALTTSDSAPEASEPNESALPQPSYASQILDISEGGLFLETDAELTLGSEVCVTLLILNKELPVRGDIVHTRPGKQTQVKGYGVRFDSDTQTSRKAIRKVIEALKALGMDTRMERPDWSKDFTAWAKQLLTTGKGWVPEPRRPHTAGAAPSPRSEAHEPQLTLTSTPPSSQNESFNDSREDEDDDQKKSA